MYANLLLFLAIVKCIIRCLYIGKPYGVHFSTHSAFVKLLCRYLQEVGGHVISLMPAKCMNGRSHPSYVLAMPMGKATIRY